MSPGAMRAAQDARQAIDDLISANGASSFAEASPIQRLWRDSSTGGRHAVIMPSVNQEVYGKARDIEWAVADGVLYLLQCRAVTTSTAKSAAIDPTAAVPATDPAEVLPAVPLFAGLTDDEFAQIATLFKARRFAAGETVIR